MTLKKKQVNPLNVLNLRKVNFPAYHFTYAVFKISRIAQINKIDKWIYLNLKGRYYIGSDIMLMDNIILYIMKVGFEQEKEMTLFNLTCHDLIKEM